MSFRQKLIHELKELAVIWLFFVVWIGVFIALKELILSEYHIAFNGLSAALIGALILAKVVLIFRNVPLSRWTRERPAWVDLVLRTVLFGAGVVVVLLLEKGFEGRHDYGGFTASLRALFQHVDIDHVWANAICITGALLVYNAFSTVGRQLGDGVLAGAFTEPLRESEDRGREAHQSSSP